MTISEINKGRRLPEAACALTALGMALCPLAHADPKPKAAATARATKKPPAKSFPVFALDVENTKLVYTVTLNGWLVDTSPGNTNGHFSSTRVGQYIADGQNTIFIHLSAPDPKFLSSFGVTVRTTGNPQLFDYGWDASVPHPHPPLPFTAEKHFTTHLLTGPWAWQTAPKIVLDTPTKQAINAHIKRLYDALNTKNVDECVALFALSNRDHAAAVGMSAAESDKNSREGWGETFASPGWHLRPVDYAHLRYDLIANERVVHVLQANGSLPLINTPANTDGQHTSIDVFLCLVHGQWAVVR